MTESKVDSGRIRFFTTGTLVLMAVMAVGYSFGLARMLAGLGAVTNLTNTYPWGIWIGVDVATGVALAAGGFVTSAVINIFGGHKFRPLERPAILTAWLGYSFVGIGLMFDLGRFYNIWHPAIYWQGNSVLFEVGMCVMFYLTVLTIEFAPAILEGLCGYIDQRVWIARFVAPLQKFLRGARVIVRAVLPIFLIAGVVLSFMHQSSLGSLMLIAPTKLSSLWWTPILPVLFLLSAIMVGLPMVIFESTIASRSFGRKSEMHLLTPLSRIIPWLLALYAIPKFTDLFLRNSLADFQRNPTDLVALLLELGIGVVIPFVMLLQPSVRKSARWLFIAASCIIAGVVLNRLNVFIIGYHPPFGESGYFPSFGEIAVTAGLVATIMFLYRFFVLYFPVIDDKKVSLEIELRECDAARRRLPKVTWVARGLAVVLILSFVVIYAVVHRHGIDQTSRPHRDLQFHKKPVAAGKVGDRLAVQGGAIRTLSATEIPTVLMLSSPVVNERTDDYESARFMHKAHAARVNGQCSTCHHRTPTKEGDRIGVPTKPGPKGKWTVAACRSCHRSAIEPDHPTRPGLKGAYHKSCVGCHEKPESGKAPVDCVSCHHRHVPDHATHMKVAANTGPREITARCLKCHKQQGQDVLNSVHWTWQGASPYVVGHEHRMDLGKKNIINNYCIHTKSNEARCSQCHIGYGWKDKSFDFKNPNNIDCLGCHDTTGTYRKDPRNGGMPAAQVNIVQVAQRVGRPSRETCGKCHFYGGGGANVKHGDLEPTLVNPPPGFDVHMGKLNLRCQACHTTTKHRIAGQCLAIPASEGRVTCKSCHSEKPHRLTSPMGWHLDRHSRTVACQTCHIPTFAKSTPTKMYWDWSTAGKDQKSKPDKYGMPTYNKKKGSFVWGKNVKPCYRWYNGKHTRYVVGDKIDPTKTTVLNQPMGSVRDRTARIYPFKCYSAKIPYDLLNKVLGVPKLWKGYWSHFDWERALRDGMKVYGIPFSGKVGFTKADMYWAINHEVVPASSALSCANCHDAKAVACDQCHEAPNTAESRLQKLIYRKAWGHNRMDFVKLGYSGDPVKSGSRFKRYRIPGASLIGGPKPAPRPAPKPAPEATPDATPKTAPTATPKAPAAPGKSDAAK